MGTLFPETSTRFLTVNGQRRPADPDAAGGEVQRWRLLQAAHQDDMFLELEKHALHAIAYDGIPSSAASKVMNQLLMAPGQRADVLVQAGAPGIYELRAAPYDQGHPAPTGPLYARHRGRGRARTDEAAAGASPAAAREHQDSEITGRRKLVLSKRSGPVLY